MDEEDLRRSDPEDLAAWMKVGLLNASLVGILMLLAWAASR